MSGKKIQPDVPLYPLRLEPVLKEAIWGGRGIEAHLGKQLPEGDCYAESWEVTDHQHGVNLILNGPLAGKPFHSLLQTHAQQLLGRHADRKRFPLLLKILDANHQLSVQVHPNDELALQMNLPDGGKDEAWVVLRSEPQSFIYAGFRSPVDETTIRAAIDEGTLESLLYRFHPEPGQSLFLPAGTVHSLGAGVLLAEIQQSSDHTFRLYDWNRTDVHGNRRQLHIEDALRALNYQQGEVRPIPHFPLGLRGSETLVACRSFVVNRHHFVEPFTITGSNRAHLLFVLQGQIQVEHNPDGQPLKRGYSMVLPACLDQVRLIPEDSTPVVILEFYID